MGQVPRGQTKPPQQYTFKVIHIFPHDPAAFTQGLAYRDGILYEGTGLNGRSSLRKVRLETGEVLPRVDLPTELFGEGIAAVNNELIELTWQSHVAFVYDVKNFRLLRKFSYPGEGWGLTNHGEELFLSDGTPEIRVLDARTFREKRRIKVHDAATQIERLNELEFVEGEVWENVWQTDRIACISPKTGAVVGWIDLAGLLSPMYQHPGDAVLNGIAYDAKKKRLFVTGKLWPSIFEIRVVRKPPVPDDTCPRYLPLLA